MFLLDTSAWVQLRHPVVAERLVALIEAGDLAVCASTLAELTFTANGRRQWEQRMEELDALERVQHPGAVLERALEVQHQLVIAGFDRVPVADVILAVTAEADAELTVLHYDRDFERIARVVEFKQEWVVRRGSLV